MKKVFLITLPLMAVAAGLIIGAKPVVSSNPGVGLFQSIAPAILSSDELIQFYWRAEKKDLAWKLLIDGSPAESLSAASQELGVELAAEKIEAHFGKRDYKAILALAPVLKKRNMFDPKFESAVYEAKYQLAVIEANTAANQHHYQLALNKLSPFKNYSKLKGENAKVLLGWKQEINNMKLYEKAKSLAKQGRFASAIDTFNAISPPFYYYQQAFKTAKTWESAYKRQIAAQQAAAARQRSRYYYYNAYEAAERGNSWMGSGSPITQTSTWNNFMNGNF
jgi:hypothetical protein